MKMTIALHQLCKRHGLLALLLTSGLLAVAQDQNNETRRVALYGSLGYHSNIKRQISGSLITDYSQYDYFPYQQSLSNVYFDLGGVYQWSNMEAGAALRISFPSTLLENGFSSEPYPIMPMANIWAARYFGKTDQRAYSVGFNITPVVYRNFYPVITTPPPNNRIPNFGSTTTYWAFGPTAATRIFRKGWFKQTYLQFNPQIAPPSASDRIKYLQPGWYWRVNFGLTKNIHFRK